MEPEHPTKKFPIIATVAIALIILGAVFLLAQKSPAPQSSVPTPVKKVYTEAEKMQYLADVASSTPVDTPTQTAAKLKILENIAKETPKDTPAETAAKLDILQAMADKANQ